MTEQPEMESAVSEPPITEGDGSERRRHVRMPVHWTGALERFHCNGSRFWGSHDL